MIIKTRKNTDSMKFSIATIFCIVFSLTSLSAEHTQNNTVNKNVLNTTMGTPISTLMNVNNISMWIRADGMSANNPSTGNSGVTYPRGTSTVIYKDGLIWGGQVHDGKSPQLRVGGQTYNIGTQAGAIVLDADGNITAESQSDPSVRIYRIRRDYATADLKQDAAEIYSKALSSVSDGDVSAVRNQYRTDWLEWPWQKGAPYYDRNNNGVYDPPSDGSYDPTKDEPGYANGDQVVWFVANDLNAGLTAGLYGSPPIGMEMQVTLWAYARTDALGNVIFKQFKFIYKGTADTPPNSYLDSMYVSQWADPDLGDYGDDFAGCDIQKSLGFVYNSAPRDAEFANFGLAPPSSGYDFFSGPLVSSPGDSAVFDLKYKQGYKNLPMTTFIYFAAGGVYSDPPLGSYNGTVQWYNMLTGRPPTPQGPPAPDSLTNPTTGLRTSYWLSGDPVAGTGWIDGSIDPPGDRRILLASGPFKMALGDTQEVVVALLAGRCANNKSSVTAIKFYDGGAQFAFDKLFNIPKGPKPPSIKPVELDKEILLDWESDNSQYATTESYLESGKGFGFRFEGYNVYQFPSISGDLGTAKLLATYDLNNAVSTISDTTVDPAGACITSKIVQNGSNSGIKRVFRITQDAFREKPLVNGRKYYFAVTAYAYNDSSTPGVPKALESPPQVFIVVPHTPNPGTAYPYHSGFNDFSFVNQSGDNDASVDVQIYNTTKATGKSYDVAFNVAGTTKSWSLINVQSGDSVIKNATTFDEQYHVVEGGFDITVTDAPTAGLRNVKQVLPTSQDVFGMNDPSGTYRVYTVGNAIDDFTTTNTGLDIKYQFVFSDTGGWAMGEKANNPVNPGEKYWMRVPFECWTERDSSGTTVRTRYFPVVFDKNGDSVWNTVGNPTTSGHPMYDSIIGFSKSKYKYPLPLLTAGAFNPASQNLKYVLIADIKGNGSKPAVGTVIQFETKRAIHSNDVKRFTMKSIVQNSLALKKKDADNINVFPNPYYGLNTDELDRYNRFVTFNHLPEKATIRIFDLSGTLVRVISKNDPSQFIQWDLKNQDNLPIASGIYIAHIEMKDIGETKILKLMVVQEQQFLPKY